MSPVIGNVQRSHGSFTNNHNEAEKWGFVSWHIFLYTHYVTIHQHIDRKTCRKQKAHGLTIYRGIYSMASIKIVWFSCLMNVPG